MATPLSSTSGRRLTFVSYAERECFGAAITRGDRYHFETLIIGVNANDESSGIPTAGRASAAMAIEVPSLLTPRQLTIPLALEGLDSDDEDGERDVERPSQRRRIDVQERRDSDRLADLEVETVNARSIREEEISSNFQEDDGESSRRLVRPRPNPSGRLRSAQLPMMPQDFSGPSNRLFLAPKFRPRRSGGFR